MHIPRHSSRSTQPTINRSFSHRFKKGQAFGPVLFLYRNPAGLKLIRQNAPASARGASGPVIDHLGGSDRRYPDRAVWRTAPAKILPVCGKAWRCGNQRSEASSRLHCLRCLPFAGVAANMWFSAQKSTGRRAKGDTGMQNQERKTVRRLRRSGCSFLQVCLPACVLRKKSPDWRARGRCENTEIRSGSLSIACPVQGVCFYRCACPHSVFRTKNPPAFPPGDFYQAFAVRWVFSRAITTGGISTS